MPNCAAVGCTLFRVPMADEFQKPLLISTGHPSSTVNRALVVAGFGSGLTTRPASATVGLPVPDRGRVAWRPAVGRTAGSGDPRRTSDWRPAVGRTAGQETLAERVNGVEGANHVFEVPESGWPLPRLPRSLPGSRPTASSQTLSASPTELRARWACGLMVLGTTKCLHETSGGRFSSASRSPWSLRRAKWPLRRAKWSLRRAKWSLRRAKWPSARIGLPMATSLSYPSD